MRLFRMMPWLFSIGVAMLFGLGVIRMDSTLGPLQWVDGYAGCFHDAAGLDPTGRLSQVVNRIGRWVGAPPTDDATNPTAWE